MTCAQTVSQVLQIAPQLSNLNQRRESAFIALVSIGWRTRYCDYNLLSSYPTHVITGLGVLLSAWRDCRLGAFERDYRSTLRNYMLGTRTSWRRNFGSRLTGGCRLQPTDFRETSTDFSNTLSVQLIYILSASYRNKRLESLLKSTGHPSIS